MIHIILLCIFLFIVVGAIFYYCFGKFIFKNNNRCRCRCSTIKGEYCPLCAFNSDFWEKVHKESLHLGYDHKHYRDRLHGIHSFERSTLDNEQVQQNLRLYQQQTKQQQQHERPYQQHHQIMQLRQQQQLEKEQLYQQQEQERQRQQQHQRIQQEHLIFQIKQQHLQQLEQLHQQKLQRLQQQKQQHFFWRYF
ncbi:hypothetical protein DICPUDRAFT_77912 [Dictyostelium purpureum]|uniref:Uncharacterized protein n=1 Tax=Dictyostelium purpureum TaxID=5786 RepID=F0ZI03_DICPU|nr:uncharacterized protein DICPUDRAFT_77912 [Dictyostelium purpureum]EGC36409.1 hypothetical protein DICPUDRAFT_77912 [Dictyostelium purpureum]|eukprot:XP_003287042.1 hypothetical protein DICPUDRAFT_77912 [Dictyostelium purpureum]